MLALWGSQLFLRPVKGHSRIPVLAGIPAGIPVAVTSRIPVLAGIPAGIPGPETIHYAKSLFGVSAPVSYVSIYLYDVSHNVP